MKQATRSAPGRGRAGARIVLLGALACLVTGGAKSPTQDAAMVGDARTALEKWVEIRKITSEERRKYEFGRELMQDRISLVERKIDSLRAKIAEANESIAEADKKRVELVAENERLKEASSALTEVVAGLEARTEKLVPRLPQPLQEHILPISQRLPEDPATTRLSLSDRFLNIVGILNAANKFNREITRTSELRALSDGSSVEVSVLYVGLGQAFYVSPSGLQAGVGRSSAEGGWSWTERNEAAQAIAQAIAVYANETPAAFVQLPTTVE